MFRLPVLQRPVLRGGQYSPSVSMAAMGCVAVMRTKLIFQLNRAKMAFLAGQEQEGTNWLQSYQHLIELYRSGSTANASTPSPACLALLNRVEVPLNLLTPNTVVRASAALPFVHSALAILQQSAPTTAGAKLGGRVFRLVPTFPKRRN